MKRYTQLFLVLTLLVLFLDFVTSAYAAQRMGLLPGRSVQIPPNGKGELPARCLDEEAPPPITSTRYTRVHNAPPDAVIVKIDGQSIPLQQALDQGLVSISGVTAPTGYVTQARIDAVRIINNTSKPIEVQVHSGAVLGESGHRPFDYDVTSLLARNASQRSIWGQQIERIESIRREEFQRRKEENIQNQTALSALGYYDGPIDGEFGAAAREGARSFQRDYGLVTDGIIGEKTRVALKDAQTQQERLQRINKDEPGFLTLTMEYQQRPSVYALYGTSGKLLYRGKRVPDLMEVITRELKGNTSQTVYLDMENFTPDKKDGFETSLRLYHQKQGAKIDVKTLERYNGKTNVQDQFFETSRRLEIKSVSEPILVETGKFKGYYRGAAQILQGTRSSIIRVYSRSKELVQKFFSRLQSLISGDQTFWRRLQAFFSGEEPKEVSPAILINKVRNELKQSGEWTDDDQVEFEDELGQIIFSRLESDQKKIDNAG